ncbi:MAG TPA: hypothetical protein VMV77_09090 [Bacteroidales bacterium]|nr:hypothetical protein [Bacteroidales bacterium]
MKKLEKSDLIWIASKMFVKGYFGDMIRYSDDLYGNEDQYDEVNEYMEELSEIGRIAFYEKYKEFKLY